MVIQCNEKETRKDSIQFAKHPSRKVTETLEKEAVSNPKVNHPTTYASMQLPYLSSESKARQFNNIHINYAHCTNLRRRKDINVVEFDHKFGADCQVPTRSTNGRRQHDGSS